MSYPTSSTLGAMGAASNEEKRLDGIRDMLAAVDSRLVFLHERTETIVRRFHGPLPSPVSASIADARISPPILDELEIIIKSMSSRINTIEDTLFMIEKV
jgi:hypothetical protein